MFNTDQKKVPNENPETSSSRLRSSSASGPERICATDLFWLVEGFGNPLILTLNSPPTLILNMSPTVHTYVIRSVKGHVSCLRSGGFKVSMRGVCCQGVGSTSPDCFV